MGRKERKRHEENGHVRQLLDESRTRELTAEEIQEVRAKYTGIGGLVSGDWSNGQFFTPPEVTSFVIDLLQIPPDSRVLEPSCGGGAFVSALPEGCQVVGIEQMHETARVAALINPQAIVHQGDSLEMLEDLRGRFDYAVGNPPFADVKHREEYRGFEMAKSSRRAEWYFLELAMESLAPGGVTAFVVPDGILSNAKDQKNRKWMMERYWLRGVISLPSETFAKTGTTVKTSVIIIQKPLDGVVLKGADYSIFMAVCEKIGWDSRGRANVSDLPKVLAAWQTMYPLGIGPHTPLVLTDPETLNDLMSKCTEQETVEDPQQKTVHESTLPPEEPVQTNVVEMETYRGKNPKKIKSCPQMAFDFGEVANG